MGDVNLDQAASSKVSSSCREYSRDKNLKLKSFAQLRIGFATRAVRDPPHIPPLDISLASAFDTCSLTFCISRLLSVSPSLRLLAIRDILRPPSFPFVYDPSTQRYIMSSSNAAAEAAWVEPTKNDKPSK